MPSSLTGRHLAEPLRSAAAALVLQTRREEIYQAWIRRYPKDTEPYQAYLDWAVEQRNRRAAASVAQRIKAAFPNDIQLILTTDAYLARIDNGVNASLAVYWKNFSPFWPDALRTQYFHALSNAHQLRIFLADAQTATAAHPTDLDPVLRLYFYYEQENRRDVADQQILALLARKAAANAVWTAKELQTVGALFLRAQDYDESAHAYYMLYELPSAAADEKELAMASLISLLLDTPEQPMNFGNRDLSLYKNIGQMDRHPGFLNGILSLALNTTFPAYQYQNASQTAVSYFHRASASRLLDELKQQFPNSRRTPELEAKLFGAYAVYGQYGAVIQSVPAWLQRNKNSPEYVDTALLLADAYIQKQDTTDELALYDRLLTELADKSDHMPIGPGGLVRNTVLPAQTVPGARQTSNARSPDYTRVLDRYISRLVQLNRVMDAVALFRREIDRNPDDPGIYERLALFVEQNELDRDVEQTYRQAFSHFKDTSWASKLARFYLRKKEYAAYQELTRQITDTFRGSQLAAFLTDAHPDSPILYRQINLYAHQRFPHNLVFVHNLLRAYCRKETYDIAAYEKLLRENWFYEPGLRTSFFEYLSSTGKLRSELAALPSVERAVTDSNVAALEFRAEGHAWFTEYEAAAPAFVRLAAIAPGDRASNERAISIERSLSPGSSGAFDAAIRLAQQDVRAAPGNLEAITRAGEIYADREMYAQARPWWNRVAAVEPGSTKGYLNSATVFWDYFQFDDALRIIGEARQKLHRPALFGYEAGAIYENESKYKEAIAAYITAALRDSSEKAKSRLITLAGRKATSPLVEQETTSLVASGFDTAAFELRLAMLERQNRRGDVGTLLSQMLPRATTSSEIDEVHGAAIRLGFDEIAAQSLQRTIAITTDPVEKIRARIELARFYEAHNNIGSAEREFSSLLNDDPNLLGVVRAVVDFHWREKQTQQGVAVLKAAAERAQQPYQNELRREAAQKAANSGQYDEARRLLDRLLENDPYNGDLLAQKAATYARQNDNPGLVKFYAAELQTVQAAPLPAQDKTERIAALRRGYILALITTEQFTDALEQYQLVLNQYPEDASLAAEVSRFAENHQLTARLTAYYQKATQDSPRDYRWPLVLARIEASLRQYPEAIASYSKAASIRPDRADILVARADLEIRLLRFDAAIQSYRKLYELSYHDPQYLVMQATTNVRMGNKTDALRLLRAAYTEPHPHEPGGYVMAMQQAMNWRMFDVVDQFFREVRPQLTRNAVSTNEAINLEATALTSLHRPADAIAIVAAFTQKAAQTEGYARQIGTAADAYLTPREKSDFAQRFNKPNGLPPQFDRYQLAQAAGLRDIEAKALVDAAKSSGSKAYDWRQLDQLQSSRLLFDERGNELEAIAQMNRPDSQEHGQMLTAAFNAYATADDTAAALRLANYASDQFPRLFVSVGDDLNARLIELSKHDAQRANAVVQYLIATGSPDTAVQAVAARGSNISTLWTSSYTALTGLYFVSPAPWAPQAFDRVLGPRTVGAELSAKSSGDALQGANWFYYAARYGDYLGYRMQPAAEDYLPAGLEANPAASDAYVALGDSYRNMKQPARAVREYRYALQLSPDRADIYDRLALVAIVTNERAQAIADWRRAFEILAARVEKGPLPPDYWQTAQKILTHMNQLHATAELKRDADNMLRAYARRNGAYNFTPFLEGIVDHAPDSRAAFEWIIQLSELPNMDGVLGQVLAEDWIPPGAKDSLYRAEIELRRKAVSAAFGEQATQLREELKQRMIEYARYLEAQRRWADEWKLLQQIQPGADRPRDLLLTAGALTGHLDDLLSEFRTTPDMAPSGEQVLGVSASLRKLGHRDLALRLEEFEYQRELQTNWAPASAWFGLARVRFEQKRNDEGLSLVRDVTLSVGAPFENLPEAVHLLEDVGLKNDAVRYASEWKTAEPWNNEAQLAFARLKGDADLVDAVRSSPNAPYSIRVRAAQSMRDMGRAVDGSDELALLTHKSITPQQASQAFYVQARLAAARESSIVSEKVQLYRGAIALDPTLRDARLDLAEAALSTKQDTLGLAAFDSYQASSGQMYGSAAYRGGYAMPLASTPPAEPDNFVTVEQLAAEALARRQDFAQALRLYDDLLARTTDLLRREQFQRSRELTRQRQTLVNLNAGRRPVVTKEITQPLIVKPKLKSVPIDWIPRSEAESGGAP